MAIVPHSFSRTDQGTFRPEVPHRVHLFGAAGAGMRSLSRILRGAGWTVTGSDDADRSEHNKSQIPSGTEVVIHSPAVNNLHPGLIDAGNRQIPIRSLPEMLGELSEHRHAICIAGTHGKSTATGLLGHLLDSADRHPIVYLGATVQPTAKNSNARDGWFGCGSEFVIEACEYRSNFLRLHPDTLVLLNLEYDHPDCFSSFEAMLTAFQTRLDTLDRDATVILNADDPGLKQLRLPEDLRTLRFGRDVGSGNLDLIANNIETTPEGLRLYWRDSDGHGTATVPLWGKFQITNILATIATARLRGLSPKDIATGLETFPGLQRRMELRGEVRGCLLIDDYGHHPTAIRETLLALRSRYPERTLIAILQTHQLSRTQLFLDDFADSVGEADGVVILTIDPIREVASAEHNVTARHLADQIRQRHGHRDGFDVRFVGDLDQLPSTMDDIARADSALVTFGAGNLFKVHDEFIRRFQRHHPV